jgi:hypothetical protein
MAVRVDKAWRQNLPAAIDDDVVWTFVQITDIDNFATQDPDRFFPLRGAGTVDQDYVCDQLGGGISRWKGFALTGSQHREQESGKRNIPNRFDQHGPDYWEAGSETQACCTRGIFS